MKKLAVFVLLISICLSLSACMMPESKFDYDNGIACFNQGRFADAAEFFVEAKGYRDSRQKLLEIYYAGINDLESGNFADAARIFAAFGSYEVNNSPDYAYIMEAYLKFTEDLNSIAFYDVLYRHHHLDGVDALIEFTDSLCYPGTSVVKFEYVVSNGSEFDSYEYTGSHDAVFTEYYPKSGDGDKKTETVSLAAEEYRAFLSDLGANESGVLHGNMNGNSFSLFFSSYLSHYSNYISVSVYN